jgi:hypothetical protein
MFNCKAGQWLTEVANQRQHRETRERRVDRFQPQALRPLPALLPDYRDTADVRWKVPLPRDLNDPS